MKLKDYFDQPDLTDPQELLNQDPEYFNWSENYDNETNRLKETLPEGQDSLEDRKHQ